MSIGHRQLLTYKFPPGSEYEGQLVGALERIESGGTMRILSAVFVGRDAAGEPVAVTLKTEGSAGMIGGLISFRLDDHARQKATQKVLDSDAGAAVRSIAEALTPGEAVAGVIVEHAWAVTLSESVQRMGGTRVVNEFVGDEHEDLWTLLHKTVTATSD